VRGAVGGEGVGVQAEGDGRPVQVWVKVLRFCRTSRMSYISSWYFPKHRKPA
jgi:hypothetical protein